MIVLGLTGGMGMGKSTAAAAFRRAGVRVFDADREVHRLQAQGGGAVKAITAVFPGACRDGCIDRAALRRIVTDDPTALRTLETILHPIVRQAQRRFVQHARRAGQCCVALDIPLLFETGADRRVDRVVAVSAPASVQRARLRRRKILPDQAAALIARQWPDRRRCRSSDFIIHTGLSRWHAQKTVRRLGDQLRKGL